MRSSADPINVFDPDFLERLAHRERTGLTFAEAEYAGPWTVRQHPRGFAVMRESESDQGQSDAVFEERELALLVAAVYPTMGRPERHQLASTTGIAGVDVNVLSAGRIQKVGWLRHLHPELVEALHVVDWLLRSPASLAMVLEAASYEVLLHAGKILERRLAADGEAPHEQP